MGETGEKGNSSTKGSSRWMERRIAAIARRQHGVVALSQLYAVGLNADHVKHRVSVDRLHRIHRAVYAVGHDALGQRGRWMGATLVADGIVLSHRSAAQLWGIVGQTRGPIHVTAPRSLRARAGLRLHYAQLPADERTVRDGIPITSVSRTLLDIAATEGRQAMERALREAHFERLSDSLGLPALIGRYPGRRGTAVVASALAAGIYAKRVRSGLEAGFLDFLAEHGLPLPETNAFVEVAGRTFEVDCIWREQNVVAELDGRRAHSSPAVSESDRVRDGLLQAHGLAVHRITPMRLRTDAAGLERQLGLALERQPRRRRHSSA